MAESFAGPEQTENRSAVRRGLRKLTALVAGALVAITMSGIALAAAEVGSGAFQFEPVPASAVCTPGGNPTQPFVLPPGYIQTVFAAEPEGGTRDLWDMNTLNETGPEAGRYLYRTHETSNTSQVSVTDLTTRTITVLAQRADWERFDGIAWTPWGTLLAAEETDVQLLRDPDFPLAVPGLVYEFFLDPDDPTKLDTTVTGGTTPGVLARPAIGARSHEGLRFDPQGNLYGITETSRVDNSPFQEGPGGFIYKFTPDTRGDLSSGQLYALKVTVPTVDRTGEAVWVALDRASVQIDSDIAAVTAGATGYDRPEDVETATSSGNNRGGANILYVAVTSENRVLAIDLREPRGGAAHETAFVTDYVRQNVNAPADFNAPDNLALDHAGTLFISEDPSVNPLGQGADIWAALPPAGGGHKRMASNTVRFASLTDCAAEPTGIYFDKDGTVLYVNAQHRGGDGRDLAIAIAPVRFQGHLPPADAP